METTIKHTEGELKRPSGEQRTSSEDLSKRRGDVFMDGSAALCDPPPQMAPSLVGFIDDGSSAGIRSLPWTQWTQAYHPAPPALLPSEEDEGGAALVPGRSQSSPSGGP